MYVFQVVFGCVAVVVMLGAFIWCMYLVAKKNGTKPPLKRVV